MVVDICQKWSTSNSMQSTLSIKVQEQLKARLRRIAKQRKTTPSQLLRDSLERILDEENERSDVSTCFAKCEDLFANLGEGPGDLSTNKNYLKSLGRK